MKTFLAALLFAATLSVAVPADVPATPAAVVPEITGAIIVSVDHKPEVLLFVWSNGALPLAISPKDCADSDECKAEVAHLVALKHVKVLELASNTQV